MISCNQHDYVEIACMFNYPLKLVLKSGEEVEGSALDTKRDQTNQECMEIAISGNKQLVLLDSISQMEVLVDNPHFSIIEFD